MEILALGFYFLVGAILFGFVLSVMSEMRTRANLKIFVFLGWLLIGWLYGQLLLPQVSWEKLVATWFGSPIATITVLIFLLYQQEKKDRL